MLHESTLRMENVLGGGPSFKRCSPWAARTGLGARKPVPPVLRILHHNLTNFRSPQERTKREGHHSSVGLGAHENLRAPELKRETWCRMKQQQRKVLCRESLGRNLSGAGRTRGHSGLAPLRGLGVRENHL